MARVGIIGGGLAGLIVAYRRAKRGDDVVLLEPTSRLGGQLWTERTEGFVIEHGAEGFVASSAAVPKLADDLGIEGELVAQRTLLSYGFDGTRLVALAPGEAGAFLGFQVPADDLGRGIRTFRHGMSQLTDALFGAVKERIEVRRSWAVSSVELHRDGVRILHGSQSALDVDFAVIASPARAAASLLASTLDTAGNSAQVLATAPVASILTVSLSYPRESVDHALDGTGFVVADPTKLGGLRACTFTNAKFEARAPDGHASMRLFFRPGADDLEHLSDAAWAERGHDALNRVIPLRAAPERIWVSRWPNALPVFNDEHRSRVTAVEAALTGRRLWLTGSAFHGSGIDRAVRSAEACAAGW
jgi:oxygen-dependent protoporphyrinogen oxidase